MDIGNIHGNKMSFSIAKIVFLNSTDSIKRKTFLVKLQRIPRASVEWNFINISAIGGRKYCLRRITCKALVLAHVLPCALYQPHAMGVMELYEGREEIKRLHCGLHSG